MECCLSYAQESKVDVKHVTLQFLYMYNSMFGSIGMDCVIVYRVIKEQFYKGILGKLPFNSQFFLYHKINLGATV